MYHHQLGRGIDKDHLAADAKQNEPAFFWRKTAVCILSGYGIDLTHTE